MIETRPTSRKAVILGPGEGRSYPMGRIAAVFKADSAETESRYSISEWWLEPHTQGPGAHAHIKDDIFYVIEGTMSVLVGEEWTHATRGSFILVPGGVTHCFENRGDVRAGALSISIPGSFEERMPEIAQWFIGHPPEDAGISPTRSISEYQSTSQEYSSATGVGTQSANDKMHAE